MKIGPYSLRSFVKGLRNPDLAFEELKRLSLIFNGKFYQRFGKEPTLDIHSEDWDNLLILDACRPDFLQETGINIGEFDTRVSPGSQSWEFMQDQFVNNDLHDTVYLTSNPHAYKIPDGTFHFEHNLLDTHWDENTQTVLPKTMAEQTIEIADRFPNKRIISHFMQPHFPFLSPLRDEIPHQGLEWNLPEEEKSDVEHPWKQLNNGKSDRETVVEAYRHNHEIIAEVIKQLVNDLPGKTIVTADHTNLIGERTWPIPIRHYGHPSGFHKSELVTVPWITVESKSRRKVVSDPPKQFGETEEDVIEDRLAALGYR